MATERATTLGRMMRRVRGNPHRRQGIDFLGDPHDADLGRDGRAGTASHQHRHQHRTKFPDDGDAEDIDDEEVRPEGLQLQGGEVTDGDADQEADQGRHRQGLGAGLEDVGREFPPGNLHRMAH